MNTRSTKNHGYTLIELIVVIGISAILLLTAVSLFFTTFVGGGKTATGEYTKQAGGQVLSQLSFLIRNSRRIVQNSSGVTCGSPMQSLKVENLDGGTSEFSVINNKIASTGANASGTKVAYLTPNDITLPTGSTLTFSCSPILYGLDGWDGSPPIVNISFSLQKGGNGLARDVVTIPFATSVTLRNY